jgi:protein-tyrosine phosphatase
MIPALIRTVLGLGSKDADARFRVLFVCMGNICRSPTAEAVFRRQVEAAGLWPSIQCASAGTHDFHVGALPDGRARAAALQRGYDMSRLRGRHVGDADFERYDLILAMDRQNMELLDRRCPPEHRDKLKMLMEFARRHAVLDVPDPYYGNAKGFELVLDMIEDACGALLEHIRDQRLGEAGETARRE